MVETVAGALGGLGRGAPPHLFGASAGGCACCLVLCYEDPRTQRLSSAAILSPTGGQVTAGLGTRVAGLAGWLTEQAPLRVAFHPGGPCWRVHLPARARHVHHARRTERGLPGASGAAGASTGPGASHCGACARRGSASARVCGRPSCSPSRSGASRGQLEPQVQGGVRLHLRPWVGPGGHRVDAGVGPRCLWLFNVNVPWEEARWAQGPSISLLQAVLTGRVTSRACVTGLAWFRGGVAGSLETGDGRAQPSHACPGPSTLVTRPHPSGA